MLLARLNVVLYLTGEGPRILLNEDIMNVREL